MDPNYDNQSIFAKFKSQKPQEHIRYWLPILDRLLFRIGIFRSIKYKLNLIASIFWLVSGKHVTMNHFSLSNYGVWLLNRKDDATYNFSVRASYMNNLDRILCEIDRDTIFVDVGANIGVFSLIAAKNPKIVNIQAFEPDVSSFEYFRLNIIRNKATKIVVHNLAIGKSEGPAFLSVKDGHSGVSRIVMSDREGSEGFDSLTRVRMVDESFLNSNLIFDENEYFVKIDVEGYELEVLETLSKTIFFSRITSFFVEFDVNLGKIHYVEEFLLSNGFFESGRWGDSLHWDALWLKH